MKPPTRVCCGQPHYGSVCPDGKVMCCVCFARLPIDQLHVLPDGHREDICQSCAEHEERRNR